MSSAAYLRWEEDEGVSLADWKKFCGEQAIDYNPSRSGRNGYQRGQVEITLGDADYSLPIKDAHPPEYAETITVSTYYGGPQMPEVARLAREIWLKFRGSISADDEIRRLIVDPEQLRQELHEAELALSLAEDQLQYGEN